MNEASSLHRKPTEKVKAAEKKVSEGKMKALKEESKLRRGWGRGGSEKGKGVNAAQRRHVQNFSKVVAFKSCSKNFF